MVSAKVSDCKRESFKLDAPLFEAKPLYDIKRDLLKYPFAPWIRKINPYKLILEGEVWSGV